MIEEIVADTESEEVVNGESWRQESFPCFRMFVQWLNDDQWLFMAAPYATRHGWHASAPRAEEDGKFIFTRAEMLERLRKYKYTRLGCSFWDEV